MTIENTIVEPILHQVYGVSATIDQGVYIVDIDLTDMNGERYRCDYVSSAEDTFGLAPKVRAWLNENEGSYTVKPYVPPSIEKVRAAMAPITPRQLRIALVRDGKSLASITAAVAATNNEEAMIEWEFATEYRRTSPTMVAIGAAIGYTPAQIDALWATALKI